MVFEVDHPDTARAKRAAVTRALGVVPEHVRFVPTDFDARALPQAMAAAGHRPGARSLIVWEGVTNYLTAPAVDATLRWCAQAAAGSRVIFTYVDRAVLDDPASFPGTERLRAALAAAGERWTFGLDPGEVPAFLGARGLVLERDVGAAEYRRLYWGAAAARMLGYEFYRIAVARVR
jgi:methyltransferase (TIGR00027 family)